MSRRRLFLLVAIFSAAAIGFNRAKMGVFAEQASAIKGSKPDDKVSFSKQVQPVLQDNCYGCHQPAKAEGGYQMTSRAGLLRGGESESPAVVPGKPDESQLLELVTPKDGKAEMPRGRPALATGDVDLIRRWITEGAGDDSPARSQPVIDSRHPPVYSRGPVITSLDYSPDGKLLAISGFHEALVWKADGSKLVARLVGLSERIETVRFSPDGTKLLVVGGNPCRSGEIQVWRVASGKLIASSLVGFDTLYGGSWSPDGRLIAIGAPDNTLRAFDAESLRQVVYMAAHGDWIRSSVFSADGKSIFTASRDMTVKMTDVATQRFVGNVTTHTPGILRGGMQAIDRRPKRNEIVVGAADGAPKLYKMEVTAAPAEGGNPNQIREYEAMLGRIYDVRFSPDGAQFVAASSLDGQGQVRCYATDSGKTLWKLDVPLQKNSGAMYAVACSPDGATSAVAGGDGSIRLVDAAKGAIRKTFMPVDIAPSAQSDANWFAAADHSSGSTTSSPPPMQVARLQVDPPLIRIAAPTDYAQLLATAELPGGAHIDATRMVHWTVEGGIGQMSPEGHFAPLESGRGRIIGELAGQRVEVSVDVGPGLAAYMPSFIRDVNPELSRVGCNAGTCHGAAKGKNGFKLSLRGYDPIFDHRALTDDLAARRINLASPGDSLMILKPTGVAPHVGGKLFDRDSSYERTLRRWIAGGAKLDLSVARVTKLEIFPKNPVIETIGNGQQMRVVATYSDATTRDVTREAFIDSGNTEVATSDRQGVLTAIRRGEAPVLARYEGSYAATTLTVMGDRNGFVWQPPETWGRIDELVANKWQRMKIRPTGLCSDAEFLRRIYLDLTGLPPTADDVRAFLADKRETRAKRDAVIERLIGSDDFIEHWTNKWADLLQVNRKFLGPEGAAAFRAWIRGQVAANAPYDQFVQKIMTATGSNLKNPPASYFKILREPTDTMEATTHLFLAVRFNCNKCHDHPFERWTQDQYYQTAAYFARLDLKPDPASGDRKIEGTSVESAKPLYEIVGDKDQGEVIHDRTKAVAPPKFPFPVAAPPRDHATRRQELADWLTSPANPYFAKSYVNRLWGYLLGAGIIEPLDDIRAGNPPSDPELLDYLTREFVDHQFDARHVLRLICRSRTYQLSLDVNRWNSDDKINYSHALARRLPAEVLYDAIHCVTGSTSRIPGVPDGTRAEAAPGRGRRLARRFSGESRPAGSRERLRVRASPGIAAWFRHGINQRADSRSRGLRPAQRDLETRCGGEGRLEADRRNLHSRPESSRDLQRNRDWLGRTAGAAAGEQGSGGAVCDRRKGVGRGESSAGTAAAKGPSSRAAVAERLREADLAASGCPAARTRKEGRRGRGRAKGSGKDAAKAHGRLGRIGQKGGPMDPVDRVRSHRVQ